MLSAWQSLANASCLIAYAIYGRVLESEKRLVIANTIIDLLFLCEHNIREAKFILLAPLPLQAIYPTQGTGAKRISISVFVSVATHLYIRGSFNFQRVFCQSAAGAGVLHAVS